MLNDVPLDSKRPSPSPEMTAHLLLPLSPHQESPWFSLNDAVGSQQGDEKGGCLQTGRPLAVLMAKQALLAQVGKNSF